MSDALKIYCKNIEEYVDFSGGETLLDIAERIKDQLSFTPVCARVNYKTEDLRFPLFSPKHVEFLPVTTPSGSRTYVRSLCMLLYKAVCECFPKATLRIEHSISHGYFCHLSGIGEIDNRVIDSLKKRMTELVEKNLPFVVA